MWEAVRILLGSPTSGEVVLAGIFAGSIIAFSFVPRVAIALLGERADDEPRP